MLRHLVILTLVVPSIGGLIQSWPAWKTKYDTYTASKSAFQLKKINKNIEGSSAPTQASEQELWSWYSQVSAGTEKTAATALMQRTYTNLGGDASVVTDFISKISVEYAKTANADPGPAYTNVYKKITAKDLVSTDTLYPLHQEYHSMTAEQKKTVASSLESPLAKAWDTAFTAATGWAAQDTYKKKTVFMKAIVVGTPADNAHGLKCNTAYLAAVANKDETTMGVFDRKIAAKLAAGLD